MTETRDNTFVFVVCGGDEHIHTLNFSLRRLKKFSNARITVLTDRYRNNIPVEHGDVVQVDTPAGFDHHQASIYIKTGLHRFLPAGRSYCYLDSDVVAVRRGVDDIFSQMIPPIRFAADHCTLRFFSPNAVRCSCTGQKEKQSAAHDENQRQLNELIRKFIPDYCPSCPYLLEKDKELKRMLRRMKLLPFLYLRSWSRMYSARVLKHSQLFRAPGGFLYDLRHNRWFDEKHQLIRFPGSDIYTFEKAVERLEAESSFRYDYSDHVWKDSSGNKVFDSFRRQPECAHLQQAIDAKFGIQISGNDWQHWNGGVFLFDDRSEEFMENWHQATMEIFRDPFWKTRDQGTLIATVWKFGLQNHPVLPREFNFIADYYTAGISHDPHYGFTYDYFKTPFDPCFVHVYHNWGKRGWEIWDAIENSDT